MQIVVPDGGDGGADLAKAKGGASVVAPVADEVVEPAAKRLRLTGSLSRGYLSTRWRRKASSQAR